MLLAAPHIPRPDFAHPEFPWMLSGEVYPSSNAAVRQIDDGEGIELPLEDEPVQDERPPGLGPKGKKGRGRGEGRKKSPEEGE